jgi:hypothetical protein
MMNITRKWTTEKRAVLRVVIAEDEPLAGADDAVLNFGATLKLR